MLVFTAAVAVVLVVSFLCSIFESVLLTLTRPQIEVLGSRHARAARLLSGFKDNMDVPIAAILILNTAAHTIGAAVAGASYSAAFDPATLWIFSILFTLAVLLFTEIIPKTLGVTHSRTLAAPVAHGIAWLTRVLWPMVTVSEKISRSLRRDSDTPVTSADEIRLLALLGRSEGAVGDRTAGMIIGATHLRQLQAHDVMLPRESVRFLSAGLTRQEAIEVVRATGHSRFPYSPSGDIDDVSGIVFAKELLDWLLEHPDGDIDWPALVRDALIVPGNILLPKLMRTFQDSHRHLALVVDEYGSVLGIATLEDVIEEIVGDIRDESDQPADDIRERRDGALIVRGSVDLRQLSARLGIDWQPEVDVTSIGGLVSETLERIPRTGDSIRWGDYRITVIRADRRRARWLSVEAGGRTAD